MKKLPTFLLVLTTLFAFGQKSAIKGTIFDKGTGETLVGANVFLADITHGTITDIDGNFELKVDPGTYTVTFSFVGYMRQTKQIEVGPTPATVEIKLKSTMLAEVEVVSDIAVDRKTPIAHIKIKPAQIDEQLAGRDIPLLLNTTPGVHATPGGGGDGDSDVKIRGFHSDFIGVLLDGIPVNDMESGRVYWSNWFGLSAVTDAVDVQRGLGASKLAIPSIGGTINILTKGIDSKSLYKIEQGIDQYGKSTTNFGYNSGTLKNGWGLTIAASYKEGPGWVDENYNQAGFYYVKVSKRLKNHLISIAAYGAPQKHSQRRYKSRIATYDSAYAAELGIDLSDTSSYVPTAIFYEGTTPNTIRMMDFGRSYNPNWGYLSRDRFNENAPVEKMSTHINEYYKPMFYLKDFWTVNEKLSVSNIAYMSLGMGGGIAGIAEQDGTSAPSNKFTPDGQVDLQWFYDQNSKGIDNGFSIEYPIDPDYHPTLFRSNYVVPMQRNEHVWYGLLTTINHQINDQFTQDFGIDLRHYKGTHFQSIYDLLGGDYYIDAKHLELGMLGEGDKFRYHDDAWVSWGGAFYMIEYSNNIYTAFINVTGNVSSFKKHDYLGDVESERKTLFGWTVKGGFNYNFTETMNVFVNGGYYDKVQGSKYIYNGYSTTFSDIENEKIKSAELGIAYRHEKLAMTINGYATRWESRPIAVKPDQDAAEEFPIGVDANHFGIEFDGTYKPHKSLEVKFWSSLGNWKWDTKEYFNNILTETGDPLFVNNRGLHVNDAPQTQFGGGFNYKPIKGLYIGLTGTHNRRYYAFFDIGDQTNTGTREETWEMPVYTLFDLHTGYSFQVPGIEKIWWKVSANVLNLFDTKYISSAQNNDSYSTGNYAAYENDAASATVYMGMPRTFTFKLSVKL